MAEKPKLYSMNFTASGLHAIKEALELVIKSETEDINRIRGWLDIVDKVEGLIKTIPEK